MEDLLLVPLRWMAWESAIEVSIHTSTTTLLRMFNIGTVIIAFPIWEGEYVSFSCVQQLFFFWYLMIILCFSTVTPPSRMSGPLEFVCGRFSILLEFDLIKKWQILKCCPLFVISRVQLYLHHEIVIETCTNWCKNAGILTRLWGRALEKFTFSYSERIWDILPSSCINIQPDKGIELILARFSKKIGNLKRIH